MSILINLAGLILIALIVWWFWMSRPGGRKPAAITSETTIIVDDGVYDPALIHARTGQPLTRIAEDTERDFFLDAAAAKDYGIVDSVVEAVYRTDKK